MPKKFWRILIASVLIIIALPLAVDWLIIGNSFPSHITNTDWVGFLGGYIGAVISGLLSLVGISWTIRYTREQNRRDRELQIRPALDVRFVNTNQFSRDKSWLGDVSVELRDNCCQELKTVGSGLLYLKNVGNGPAMNVIAEATIVESKRPNDAYFVNQNAHVTTTSIRPGEESSISIDVKDSIYKPKPELLSWMKNTEARNSVVPGRITPPLFTLKVLIKYSDLLNNHIEQELEFKARYVACYDEQTQTDSYICELNLEHIMQRQ